MAISPRLCALATTLAAASAAPAVVLVYHSTLPSFLASSGPAPIVGNFEELGPTGTLLGGLDTGAGHFTPLDGEPFPNVYIMPAPATNFGVPVTVSTVLTANGNESWRLTFPALTLAVGFETILNAFGPGSIDVLGAGDQLLGTFVHDHVRTEYGFLGITSDTPIVAIRYTTTTGRLVNTGVDNIRLAPRCPADVGVQGGLPGHDGLLDNNDFVVFIGFFFNQLPAADFGRQGGLLGSDGLFDNNDFVVYIDLFFHGCPA